MDTNHYDYFVSFEVTYPGGRTEAGNGDYSIQGGIESIGDVRQIESYFEESIGDGVSVTLQNFRPFLGASEFATETTTETVTVVQDEPAWGSRY